MYQHSNACDCVYNLCRCRSTLNFYSNQSGETGGPSNCDWPGSCSCGGSLVQSMAAGRTCRRSGIPQGSFPLCSGLRGYSLVGFLLLMCKISMLGLSFQYRMVQAMQYFYRESVCQFFKERNEELQTISSLAHPASVAKLWVS